MLPGLWVPPCEAMSYTMAALKVSRRLAMVVSDLLNEDCLEPVVFEGPVPSAYLAAAVPVTALGVLLVPRRGSSFGASGAVSVP